MVKRTFQPGAQGTVARRNGLGSGPRTLIEDAYTRLCDDIVEGRLAPGEKLRVEHLRLHYEVSAGTLREALTRLVSDALVVSEGQRGFWVAPMSIADLEDLTRLRMRIEIDALRRSIREGDDAWRERVRVAYQALALFGEVAIAKDRLHWETLNANFHDALISGFSSPWTVRILRLLARQSERYRRLSIHLTHANRHVDEEHRMIYEAAMSGEEARAALALEAHIRETPNLILNACRRGELSLEASKQNLSSTTNPQLPNQSSSGKNRRTAAVVP
jgi:DNA-binding GntR family transcriptional regulator